MSTPVGVPAELSAEQADATMQSKPFVGLLAVVSIVGVLVSLAAWCFLEGIYQTQHELYVHLPHAVGYSHGPPKWWPLPILAVGALIVALAITRLPGDGGHVPAHGLSTSGPGLVSQAGTWSLSALAWLILFKGLAYGLSLGSFRGGPVFPALFLGSAAGIMFSHLPGFPLQAGVAVGMGAAFVAVLRLPLSAVVVATLLTAHAGSNVEPLIIVGVVVAYMVTLLMRRVLTPHPVSSTSDQDRRQTASSISIDLPDHNAEDLDDAKT